MKAAVTTAYGPPENVIVKDVPKPLPGHGEILVKVHASPVTAGDARIRGMDVPTGFGPFVRLAFGLIRPRHPVQGWALAGVIDRVGEGVENLRPGDRVIGRTGLRGGAHADYAVISQDKAWPLPASLSMEEGAAFLFGGLTALYFLIDKAGLTQGESVLINGATGAVGSAALQIAKSCGAVPTAVCSGANAGLAHELGAFRVIDYTKAEIDGTYDVILDIPGTLPYAKAKHLLNPGGRLLLVTASFAQTVGAALRPRRGTHRVIAGSSVESGESISRLLSLHKEGAYRPILGKVLPFSKIVEAHAVAGSMHKSGNLVVKMI